MVDERDQQLLAKLEAIGEVTQSHALKLVDEIYLGGVISEVEADSLFDLNRRLSGNHPRWERRFIDIICDYLVGGENTAGGINQAKADWLITQITSGREQPDETEIDLLVMVCCRAKGVPRRLFRFALRTVCDRIIDDGVAIEWNAERVRQLLEAGGAAEGSWISRFEAEMLLKTNDAIGFSRNDPLWNNLFARAIANHLLAAAHPDPGEDGRVLGRREWLLDVRRSVSLMLNGRVAMIGTGTWFDRIAIDPDAAARARSAAQSGARRRTKDIPALDATWFMKRLGWNKDVDDSVSPAERTLITFLNREIPGFTDGLTATHPVSACHIVDNITSAD